MGNQRWYDADPIVSLAVSLIKSSDIGLQLSCAELIKENAQNHGIVLNSNLLGAFNYVLNRWYDNSEQLTEAFEYLKTADEETRKQISLNVIDYLQTVATSNDKN